MTHPERTDRLIVLNLPHPRGLLRELATNPQQQKNSQYARDFQKPDAAKTDLARSPDRSGSRTRRLARSTARRSSDRRWKGCSTITRPTTRASRTMRRPTPKPPAAGTTFPPVKCPVLLIHGLKDQALLPGALNDTWNWIDADLTLVDDPRRRPFRPAGCRRSGHPHDGQLAGPIGASRIIDSTSGGPSHVRTTRPRRPPLRASRRLTRPLARVLRPSARPFDLAIGLAGQVDPRPIGRDGVIDVHPAAARRARPPWSWIWRVAVVRCPGFASD